MPNINSGKHTEGVVETTTKIINDIWFLLKYHEERKLVITPTACFKARSMIIFAVLAELFCFFLPRQMKISAASMIEHA